MLRLSCARQTSTHLDAGQTIALNLPNAVDADAPVAVARCSYYYYYLMQSCAYAVAA
jgi:hypothetical protein